MLNYVAIIFLFFSEVDLSPHLLEVAALIGWKDMRYIAIKNGIPLVKIESVEMDNRTDHEQKTFELLCLFHEKHSQEAAKKLIESLRAKGKNGKAHRVETVLLGI